MTRVILLENLKTFTWEATRDLIMPVAPSEEEPEPKPRAAGVHICGLSEFSAVSRRAPCILHQIVTSKDVQVPGERLPRSAAVVRTAFCVYCEDEDEGGLMLLGLMERLRIALLRKVVIGKQYKLDLEAGLETLIYDSTQRPTKPYYLGEMISVWKLPFTIEREVPYDKRGESNVRPGGPGAGCGQPCGGRFLGGVVPGPGGKD